MKLKIVLSLLAAFLGVFPLAQSQNTVVIPDPNFVAYLQLNFGSCMTGNLMDTTCTLVTNSNGMSLFGKNISNFDGLQYFDSCKVLDISNNPATSLPMLPRTLRELTAENIPLTALPTLPTTLERLTMKNNYLTTLPALPDSLWDLRVEANDLVSLPTLPPMIFSVQVPFNNLTSLPALPASLRALNIYANQVTVLPTLPPTMTNLEAQSNQLSSLPALPNTLTYLDISSNNLSVLPATLPPNLNTFACGYNQFSTMPALPASLINFSCGSNQLSSIPPLPPGLMYFYCHENLLTSIPNLPPQLRILFCHTNAITALPALPDTLINMNVGNNQISCFPPLPPNAILTLFPNPATCLPNYTAPMTATLLAYPLCVAGDPLINPNSCLDGTGIYGTAYHDGNSDCLFGSGESTHPNLPFELRDASSTLLQRGWSTYTGAYYLNGPVGNYTVVADTTGIPYLDMNCPGGNSKSVSLTALNPVASGEDFQFECNGRIDLGVQAVQHTGWVFPGQQHELYVDAGDLSTWYGFHCAAGVSGQISVTVNGPVTYLGPLGGAQTPSVSGSTFTYTVADFGTWALTGEIALSFMTDTTAQSGNPVCVTVTLSSTGNDAVPANNTFQHCYTVVNSYDPNYKETYPEQLPIGSTAPITYTIHFQNNGTAPAFNIILRDTLDAQMNLGSFEPRSASHNHIVTLVGNALTVKFPNINLIDSATNYAASQGYFQYSIRPMSGLGSGATLHNTASIYFDFNAPIVTNTTVNSFTLPMDREETIPGSKVLAFPNPSDGMFYLQLEGMGKGTLRVTDVLGQVVLEQAFSGTAAQIDLGRAPAGMYFVQANGLNGKHAQVRLVKE